MFEVVIVKLLPLLKEFLPWVIILGTIVRWLWERKDKDEAKGLTRLETLSRVEEKLREALEKQLAATEVKLEIANREIDRMRLMLAKYELELNILKKELQDQIDKGKE